MAAVKWIKIVTDIFDDEKIQLIESMPDADSIIVIWFKLLCMAKLKNKYGVYAWKVSLSKPIEITDDVLKTVFRKENAPELLGTLEEYGFIKRHKNEITIIPFWLNRNSRNTTQYRGWRQTCLERDGFTCQGCGTKKNLHVHHIIRWEDCTGDKEELRYLPENGITLCKACHLEAHGGCWRG